MERSLVWLRGLGPLVVTLIAAWALLGAPPSAPPGPPGAAFGIDEAEYLAMGAVTVAQLLGEGDASLGGQLNDPTDPIEDPWRDGVHRVTYGFQSPGLPKLAFGWIARRAGVTEVPAEIWPRYVPKELSKKAFGARRQAAKARLLPALAPARGLMRLLAALVAVLCFAAARRVAATWQSGAGIANLAGALAALAWISSPAVAEAAHHVRPGLFMILFWCAGLYLGLAALGQEQPSRARDWWLAAGLGLALGLACASKPNGALLAPLIPVFLWLTGSRGMRLGLLTSLAAALSIGLFIALAPGLWHDPVGGLERILAAWRGDLAHQARRVAEGVRVPTGRLDAAWMALGGLGSTAGPLAGLVPWLGSLAGLLGLVALGCGARRSGVDRLLLAWSLVLLAGSALIMPIERLRYLTPMVPPLAIAGGLLLARLAARLRPPT